jgi:1,4-alpha-glucan branching enzyme
VIYTHNDNRVIAFTRTYQRQQLLVLASLNDVPFDHGYVVATDSSRRPADGWRETFNSDAAMYGGDNVAMEAQPCRLMGGRSVQLSPLMDL